MRRVVLAVALALLLTVLLAGCANSGAMPRLHVNVTVDPKAHEAVILITARGGPGAAYSGIVLSYPDGHRRILDTFTFGANDVDYRELDGLPSGVYTCTAYAVPQEPTDELFRNGARGYRPFPVGKTVKQNVAASATFVVP